MSNDDRWLERWTTGIRDKDVLELGCGNGRDSILLSEHARILTACDQNIASVSDWVGKNPQVRIVAVDHSRPLPFERGAFDVVIASLCLHYFTWSMTQAILREIHRVLKPEGMLIGRVNSSRDIYFGSTGYDEIEPDLYWVNGISKRFFDHDSIMALLEPPWRLQYLQEKTIDRYSEPKVVWEFKVISSSIVSER